MGVWSVTGTPNQVKLVNEAIAACDFPFDALLPKLQAQTGKTSIPVVWSDLSAWGTVAPGSTHKHVHDKRWGTGHIVSPPNRKFVAGLAWSNGKIEIDFKCENIDGGQLAREVFLAEAAHAVDFFYLTQPMREAIWRSLHGGTFEAHPAHDWFEPAQYGDQIGEAWMAGFVLAFSNYDPWQGAWSHQFTNAQAEALRPVILPGDKRVVRLRPYKTFHRLTCYTVRNWRKLGKASREELFATRQLALQAGMVACKVCKP